MSPVVFDTNNYKKQNLGTLRCLNSCQLIGSAFLWTNHSLSCQLFYTNLRNTQRYIESYQQAARIFAVFSTYPAKKNLSRATCGSCHRSTNWPKITKYSKSTPIGCAVLWIKSIKLCIPRASVRRMFIDTWTILPRLRHDEYKNVSRWEKWMSLLRLHLFPAYFISGTQLEVPITLYCIWWWCVWAATTFILLECPE